MLALERPERGGSMLSRASGPFCTGLGHLGLQEWGFQTGLWGVPPTRSLGLGFPLYGLGSSGPKGQHARDCNKQAMPEFIYRNLLLGAVLDRNSTHIRVLLRSSIHIYIRKKLRLSKISSKPSNSETPIVRLTKHQSLFQGSTVPEKLSGFRV